MSMGIREQAKQTANNFETSTHTLFSRIAESIAQKIKIDTDMDVKLTGKTITGNGAMTATLVGEIETIEGEVGNKIRRMMDELKNPTKLIDLLK